MPVERDIVTFVTYIGDIYLHSQDTLQANEGSTEVIKIPDCKKIQKGINCCEKSSMVFNYQEHMI